MSVTQNTSRLMPYQVFELTFQHEGRYRDPTWDVTIDVTFASPRGKTASVGGFFYGSSKPQKPVVREWTDRRGRRRTSAHWPCDPPDLWKARYAPSELPDQHEGEDDACGRTDDPRDRARGGSQPLHDSPVSAHELLPRRRLVRVLQRWRALPVSDFQ
ncbi:DUF5060 domain-containing protein [PVC group bacterium]|nr:DUF5060 domain-containing protein [PVC group bacterium]